VRTHFNTTIAAFCDWFQQIGMSSHSAATALAAESSSFMHYGMSLSFILVMCFMLPNSVCILLKTNFKLVLLLEIFYFLLLVFHKFLEPNRHLTLKQVLFVMVMSSQLIANIETRLNKENQPSSMITVAFLSNRWMRST